jgi:hypothetical protein
VNKSNPASIHKPAFESIVVEAQLTTT